MGMTVLLVGSGGREHALAWKLSQSSRLERLFITPGNPGTDELGINVNIRPDNIRTLLDFAERNKVDLTVVGPEVPLAANLGGCFRYHGLRVFGPSQGGAALEYSKAHAKWLMNIAKIPTTPHREFTDYREARRYLRQRELPVVLKASGLAAGKGVFVCHTAWDVIDALDSIMRDKVFGAAGDILLVEDCLVGREVSVHAFTDGMRYQLMPSAQDHKTLYEDGHGPNTGGMGVVAPVPWFDTAENWAAVNKIVARTLNTTRYVGRPFAGCLYSGLMVNDASPRVLEYNVRFGDPEAQVLMPLLKSDLLDVAEACAVGRLGSLSLEWRERYAVCVILAAPGYPRAPVRGLPIIGVERAQALPHVQVFHSGTALDPSGDLVTAGGRVLSVVGIGATVDEARSRAYGAVSYIYFDGMHFRRDIGAHCR